MMMQDRVSELEDRLAVFSNELSSTSYRLEGLRQQLNQAPEASGWRSLRRDIASVRWRQITFPLLTGWAAHALNACATVGFAAFVVLQYQ